MSQVAELTRLLFHTLLAFVGVFIAITILRVYELYQTMKINRSVMTPMLVAGVFTALTGITELIIPYIGDVGEVVHGLATLLAAIFFAYGTYSYQQMLKRATKLH